MDGNEDIFVRLMNDEAFRNIASGYLMKAVYQQIRASDSSSKSLSFGVSAVQEA
jgi:type I restriction enzyme R subunit